jgi:hypothetical protein
VSVWVRFPDTNRHGWGNPARPARPPATLSLLGEPFATACPNGERRAAVLWFVAAGVVLARADHAPAPAATLQPAVR